MPFLPRPRWRLGGLWLAVLAAAGFGVFGLIPLLGLPGAVVLELSAPAIALALGPGALDALPPDAAWPLAILLTLLWPVSIVAAYLLACRRLAARRRWQRVLACVGVLYAWGAALSIWLVHLAEAAPAT